MENFTPVASFGGGLLIGLAAVILMAINGRIAGVSGITAGLLSRDVWKADWLWRASFVIGIVVAAPLLKVMGVLDPSINFVSSVLMTAFAGLLVGFGTVIGNGCTSGHGVCGVSRLSMRSVAATAVFMTAGILTVYLVRHILQVQS